jgi:excisionase family DNA binding protein
VQIDELMATVARNAEDPLLTPIAASKRIGVSPATVRRWIRDGAMASERIGPTRRRVRASVVDAMAPKRDVPRETNTHETDAMRETHTL